VQATNSTPEADCIGDYLAGLPVDQNDKRGYNRDRTAQDDLKKARLYIYNTLARLLGAANVSYQRFNSGGYAGVNIIAVLPGRGPNLSWQYVIGAHYDSVENAGADDNGSGIAGLLEAARVLSQYQFDATIIFIALDQEEQRANGWGQGSRFYANQARIKKANIKAMLGLDMIAYNDHGDKWIALSRCDWRSVSSSAQLLARVRQAFRDYTDLGISSLTGEDGTDPYRFYKAGFASVLVSEDLDYDGWPLNPYWHEPADYYRDIYGNPQKYAGANYIDLTYAQQAIRGVVGWAATEAGLWD
jgi:Zn-dependent M28 family amino/carboxypeptidase